MPGLDLPILAPTEPRIEERNAKKKSNRTLKNKNKALTNCRYPGCGCIGTANGSPDSLSTACLTCWMAMSLDNGAEAIAIPSVSTSGRIL